MATSPQSEDAVSERLDRELHELLQELRVLLPGTTVLFGFFLATTFSGHVERLTGEERGLFLSAFLTTAVCTVLLTAPGVRHRTRFREHDKQALVQSANRIVLGAAALLALAVGAVTTLVVEQLYDWTAGLCVGGASLVLATWYWFGWALLRRAGGGERDADPGP